MHVEDALEAINFEKTLRNQPESKNSDLLTNNAYYKVSKIDIENSSIKFENDNQLRLIISVKGKGFIEDGNVEITNVKFADIILIPAALPEFSITTEENMELLIVTLN